MEKVVGPFISPPFGKANRRTTLAEVHLLDGGDRTCQYLSTKGTCALELQGLNTVIFNLTDRTNIRLNHDDMLSQPN